MMTMVPTPLSLQAWVYEVPGVVDYDYGTCLQVLCGFSKCARFDAKGNSILLRIAGVRPWYLSKSGWGYKGKWKEWAGRWGFFTDGEDVYVEVQHWFLNGNKIAYPL